MSKQCECCGENFNPDDAKNDPSVKSMNDHLKKIGHDGYFLPNPNNKILSSEQKEIKKCTKTECDKDAIYFANFLGDEKLLCDMHGEKLKRKCSMLPSDLWFCKKLLNY